MSVASASQRGVRSVAFPLLYIIGEGRNLPIWQLLGIPVTGCNVHHFRVYLDTSTRTMFKNDF
jgi:hypothetical protein